MVTTLIEWDTMSCSSRAIRVRSSWAIARGLLLALGLEPVGPGDGLLGPGGAVAGDGADGPRAGEEHEGGGQVARFETVDDAARR